MLARARIKSGKADRLRAWYDELHERESEVIETLQHEGIYTETVFMQSIDGTEHLYGYMEAADLRKADKAGDGGAYEIDEEHHTVLEETLVGDWQELEPIGHFTNSDRESEVRRLDFYKLPVFLYFGAMMDSIDHRALVVLVPGM